MEFGFAEFVGEYSPGKSGDIFDGGNCFGEMRHIDVEVPVVDEVYKVVSHNLFEGAEMETSSIRGHFDNYFGDVIMAVTGGVSALTENIEVLLFGEIIVPEPVSGGEFEFFA